MPTAWLILMNSRLSAVETVSMSPLRHGGIDITLGAAADEEATLTDKVLGDISKLLQGLRHCG
jgi:hypothetical protein